MSTKFIAFTQIDEENINSKCHFVCRKVAVVKVASEIGVMSKVEISKINERKPAILLSFQPFFIWWCIGQNGRVRSQLMKSLFDSIHIRIQLTLLDAIYSKANFFKTLFLGRFIWLKSGIFRCSCTSKLRAFNVFRETNWEMKSTEMAQNNLVFRRTHTTKWYSDCQSKRWCCR